MNIKTQNIADPTGAEEVEAEVIQDDFKDFVRGENNKTKETKRDQPHKSAEQFSPNDNYFVDGHLEFGTTKTEMEKRRREGKVFVSHQAMIPAMTLDRASGLIMETRRIFMKKGLVRGFFAGLITAAIVNKCSSKEKPVEKSTTKTTLQTSQR